MIHDGGRPTGHGWKENYITFSRNLLSFINVQALGLPEFNHALFALYNIEAVSLIGNRSPEGGAGVDLVKIGVYMLI